MLILGVSPLALEGGGCSLPALEETAVFRNPDWNEGFFILSQSLWLRLSGRSNGSGETLHTHDLRGDL